MKNLIKKETATAKESIVWLTMLDSDGQFLGLMRSSENLLHCQKWCRKKKTIKEEHEQEDHVKDHAGTSDEIFSKFTCNQCKEVVEKEQEIESHMKTVHGDVFQCNECEQTFLDGELLLNHRETKHFGNILKVLS